MDTEIGLHYYRARYYSSDIGRFLSEDEIGTNDGFNLYLYVQNDPINSRDPTGLYTLKGFSPGDEQKMKTAIQNAIDKLGDSCEGCAGSGGPRLRGLLQGATFVYKPDLKDKKGRALCGYVGPKDWIKRRIEVGISAFGPDCCSLASTLLHEASHLRVFHGGEPSAYKLEKDCFNCGTGKPPED